MDVLVFAVTLATLNDGQMRNLADCYAYSRQSQPVASKRAGDAPGWHVS